MLRFFPLIQISDPTHLTYCTCIFGFISQRFQALCEQQGDREGPVALAAGPTGTWQAPKWGVSPGHNRHLPVQETGQRSGFTMKPQEGDRAHGFSYCPPSHACWKQTCIGLAYKGHHTGWRGMLVSEGDICLGLRWVWLKPNIYKVNGVSPRPDCGLVSQTSWGLHPLPSSAGRHAGWPAASAWSWMA